MNETVEVKHKQDILEGKDTSAAMNIKQKKPQSVVRGKTSLSTKKKNAKTREIRTSNGNRAKKQLATTCKSKNL